MGACFRNLVGGEWLDGHKGSTPNINPSDTSDVIGIYASGDAATVEAAVACGRAAFAGWSRTTPQIRHDILKKVGDELISRQDELGRLLAREEGKTLREGIAEVLRAGHIFLFFAAEALRIPGERLASVRSGVDIDVTREALGVIGLITPWNFPFAIPAWKIAPALAYGNCVVFKPAELVPGSAWALAEIISRSGVPAGVFNLVMGEGGSAGKALVEHRGVAAVSFTGSVGTGTRIAAAAAVRPMKKIQLEMGGKNPLVVLDDADLAASVEIAVNGAFFSTGQRCTASSRFIVTEGIHDRFVNAVKERMITLSVGHALDPETVIGPVVDARQLESNVRYIGVGKREGATLAFGGRQLVRETQGHYLEPTLFTDVTNDMRIAQEEIFGPVAAVIRVRDYDEALAVSNDVEFGLSAGICTTSLKYACDFKRNSEAGMVMVNLPTAGVDYHAPFGGRKGSSFGSREQGRYAADFYTAVKTAYTSAG
jgi:aldehyde dehydrogenase (NAD+)